MKYIIAGTNRPGSKTLELAKVVKAIYDKIGEKTEIIDLQKVPMTIVDGSQYGKNQPDLLREYIQKVDQAEGLVFIVPEYNGSYPGVLKYFIDHWSYPVSFEYRPVAFVGLGGRFGALRPVEHLQQVFGYRNAFVFPQRVFLSNVTQTLKDGVIHDPMVKQLLDQQATDFCRFIKALKSQELDANSVNKKKSENG